MQAEDLDSGPNGRITYTLQGTGANDFYIDDTTGWIYNRGTVEYSPDRATINLAIKAADGGTPLIEISTIPELNNIYQLSSGKYMTIYY